MNTWDQRLNSVLRSWLGTPWCKGQCVRGIGIDCFYFVTAVLDELHGITAELPPRLPMDTAQNNRPLALATVRAFTNRYPCEVLRDVPIESGDMLIGRRGQSHDETFQHAMIVGPEPVPQLWHCPGPGHGVCYSPQAPWIVVQILRPTEKTKWI